MVDQDDVGASPLGFAPGSELDSGFRRMLVKHLSLTFFDYVSLINSYETWHLLGLASVSWYTVASHAVFVLVLVCFMI